MNTRLITITNNGVSKTVKSISLDDSAGIAARLASTLHGGDVVALSGELGAGKTVFAKGIAKALGVKETVTSPTFVLMMRYRIPVKNQTKYHAQYLYHIDTYRLQDQVSIMDAGIDEYIGASDAITVIEWPDTIRDILPKETIHVLLA